MNRTMKQRLAAILLTGAALAPIGVGAAMAAPSPDAAGVQTASATTVHPDDVIYTTRYAVSHVSGQYESYNNWQHCGIHVTASSVSYDATCSWTSEHGNTISATMGVSGSVLNGQVGWTVSASNTSGVSVTGHVPGGQSGFLDYRDVYRAKTITFQPYRCQGGNVPPGYGCSANGSTVNQVAKAFDYHDVTFHQG